LERGMAGELEEDIYWYKLDDLYFPLDIKSGQKTGGYLDQVASRKAVSRFANGTRFLDAFCYTGGFGLYAAKAGAKEVVLVDSSESALELAVESFKRNNLAEPVVIKRNLLQDKTTVDDLGGRFDMTVIDPPPLIRNKSKIAEGLRKYESLFVDAYDWTKPEGLAAVFTCSHHMHLKELIDRTKRAQWKAQRRIKRLSILEAGMDHPVAASHPETEYLHGLLLSVG